MTLCQECPKKSECVELCAEAELYVNQDNVRLMELPISGAEYGEMHWYEGRSVIYLTELEKKISKLQEKCFSPQEISYLLDIAIQTVYNNICNIRKKYNNS